MTEAYCDECGARNRSGARFCSGCGRPLAAEESATAGTTGTVVRSPTTPRPEVPDALRRALLPELVLERPIGRGGMGIVYLARDVGLDRDVAVKVLPPGDAGDAVAVERFLREARVAARLRHPHIVSVHQVGERSGERFFSMDFVDGFTLGQLVHRDGRLAPARACGLMAAVADALAHAHRHGVVHRDVKPSNVMIQVDGHAFVMDFGLARRHGTASLTEAGAVYGTPEYMAPEQADGEVATSSVDVYAFGLTLFFALAGRHLVQGDGMAATVARHLTADLPAEIEKEPLVPAELRRILSGLVERQPARRLASLEGVGEALRAAASGKFAPGGVPLRASSSHAPPAAVGDRASLAPRTTSRSASTPTRRRTRERLQGLLDKLGESSTGRSPAPREGVGEESDQGPAGETEDDD